MVNLYGLCSYFLNDDEKGRRLLKRGDKSLKKRDPNKARKHFEEAKKYNDQEASMRLEQLNPSPSSKNRPPPIKTEQKPNKTATNVKSIFHSNKLAGSYFQGFIPSNPSTASTSTSELDNEDPINYTFQDAPSTLMVANMFNKANTKDKMIMYKQINKIIQQFDGDFSSPESIQELSVLASIPDQQIFIAVISRLLDVEKSYSTLPELTIHGLAVILASTPVGIDLKNRQGLLSSILKRLQYRLDGIQVENNSKELLPLLRALSSLFDVMLCRNMGHLARKDIYNPIVSHLSDIASDETVDPEVSFLAHYTTQSLAYIGNDESLSMCIFRRGRLAIGIINDTKTLVLNADLEKFDSIYNKIVEMSDITTKLKWYQGLLFIDCLLGKEDLSSLEEYILKCPLNSNEYFMQGVCLRLEELASAHFSNQVVHGSIKFLQDIESHSTGIIQKTASASLKRLEDSSFNQSFSSSSTNKLSTGTNFNFPWCAQASNFPTVWDRYWYTDSNSFLLKSVQATEKQNLNMQNADQSYVAIQDINKEIKKLIPTSNNMVEVNKALAEYYSSQLTIRRVSGDELGLESCYINLAIVEAERQRESEKKSMERQKKSFVRFKSYEEVSSTNTAKPIPLDDILDERIMINGSTGRRRILIIGRAGVGKTTLCKKIVHKFLQGLWNSRFKAILWIPLRQLRLYKARTLEELLVEKYFNQGARNKGGHPHPKNSLEYGESQSIRGFKQHTRLLRS